MIHIVIALRLDGNDLESLWERALIYSELNEPRKAIDGFQTLLKNRPKDLDIIKEVARVYHQLGQTDKAIDLLREGFDNDMNSSKDTQAAKRNDKKKNNNNNNNKDGEVVGEGEGEEGGTDNIDFHAVNILMELYMGRGDFELALELVSKLTQKQVNYYPMNNQRIICFN